MAGREGMIRPESSCGVRGRGGRERGEDEDEDGVEDEDGEVSKQPSIWLWRDEKG